MIRLPSIALLSLALAVLGGARASAQPAKQAEPIPPQTIPGSDEEQQEAANATPDTNKHVFTNAQVGQDVPLPAGAPKPDYHGDPPRIQSNELAGALLNGVPKYAPPAPVQAQAQEEPKPRNGVIRLPQVVVHEEKPPVFNEKQMYTPQSLQDIQIQRYTGLDPAKMPGVAAPITRYMFADYAKQMQSDADRQQNISDSNDMARAAALGGEPGESEYIKRVSNDTYMRSLDTTPDTGDSHGGGLESPPAR
jgi:hypothetical protein